MRTKSTPRPRTHAHKLPDRPITLLPTRSAAPVVDPEFEARVNERVAEIQKVVAIVDRKEIEGLANGVLSRGADVRTAVGDILRTYSSITHALRNGVQVSGGEHLSVYEDLGRILGELDELSSDASEIIDACARDPKAVAS
jgi:hypothetical protein